MHGSTIHDGNGNTFCVEQDRIEVTRLRRPDEHWRYTDKAGHLHQWHVEQKDGSVTPADRYDPTASYVVPTLETVVDIPETEDYPAVTHQECRICRETIWPGYCADQTRQYIAGLRYYSINGQSVSEDEFMRRAREAFPDAGL